MSGFQLDDVEECVVRTMSNTLDEMGRTSSTQRMGASYIAPYSSIKDVEFIMKELFLLQVEEEICPCDSDSHNGVVVEMPNLGRSMWKSPMNEAVYYDHRCVGESSLATMWRNPKNHDVIKDIFDNNISKFDERIRDEYNSRKNKRREQENRMKRQIKQTALI